MKWKSFGNQTQSDPSLGLLRLSKSGDYGAVHMGTRRSRTGGDLEGCDSEIVQLEPVNVKWLDGFGKEDDLLSRWNRATDVL